MRIIDFFILCFPFSLFLFLFRYAAGKLRFIRSRWGGKLLVLNKYLYSQNKRLQIDGSSTKIWWRCTFCSQRKKNPCHARCITKDNEIVKISSSFHNHPPPCTSALNVK